MRQLVLIAHNLRSSHNVGSLLRTADGLGITKVYLTGYTPYPQQVKDARLPHLAKRINGQIAKTALGAEKDLGEYAENLTLLINELKSSEFVIAGLEQSDKSLKLPDYNPSNKLVLIVGNEVNGLDSETLKLCDVTLEIPMFGHKESFNVVQASAMALYHLRFN